VKLKLTSIIVFLVPALAHADVLNLNDQPLFWSLTGNNPTYHDAAFKAQQAFFIQSGVTPAVDKIQHMVGDKATNTATVVINDNTPLDAKTLFFLGGAAYAVCVKKSITKSFHDPFIHSITHTVSVDQNSASTGIQIPF